MWSVTYEIRPHGAITYTVPAPSADGARSLADRHFRIECVGYKVRKVTVKKAAA